MVSHDLINDKELRIPIKNIPHKKKYRIPTTKTNKKETLLIQNIQLVPCIHLTILLLIEH